MLSNWEKRFDIFGFIGPDSPGGLSGRLVFRTQSTSLFKYAFVPRNETY